MTLRLAKSRSKIFFGLLWFGGSLLMLFALLSEAAAFIRYEAYYQHARPCDASQLQNPRCIVSDTVRVTGKSTSRQYVYSKNGSGGYRLTDILTLSGSHSEHYSVGLGEQGSDFYDAVHVGETVTARIWMHDVLSLSSGNHAIDVTTPDLQNSPVTVPYMVLTLFAFIVSGWAASILLIRKTTHTLRAGSPHNPIAKAYRFLLSLYER